MTPCPQVQSSTSAMARSQAPQLLCTPPWLQPGCAELSSSTGALWVSTDFCWGSGLAETRRRWKGNAAERIPCAQTHTRFSLHLSPNRSTPGEQGGCGGLQPVEKAKLKAPVQKIDPALKPPLVTSESHQILPKHKTHQRTWPETHGPQKARLCLRVCVTTQKVSAPASNQGREFFILTLF